MGERPGRAGGRTRWRQSRRAVARAHGRGEGFDAGRIAGRWAAGAFPHSERLALETREIPFGTSIANIYSRHPHDYAHTAALIHELSGGRFRFGIGVSHAPVNSRLGGEQTVRVRVTELRERDDDERREDERRARSRCRPA